MKITLAHGGGGREMNTLISDLIGKHLSNPVLDSFEDAAVVETGEKTVFSTDSFVVKPLFFPGGNIGKLAVCGTVNDIAMRGGVCRHLSLGLILEEGFETDDLENILETIGNTCRDENITVVCGDTKVVERGSADGVYINTAGIGTLDNRLDISVRNAVPGDVILVNGPVGEHGAAILGARKELNLTSSLQSDCAPLTGLVQALAQDRIEIHTLRDATRGGVSAVVNEIGNASGVTAAVELDAVPVSEQTEGVCSLLGMNPLDLANEGKLLAVVPKKDAEKALEIMRSHPLGLHAALIGSIEEQGRFPAVAVTAMGVRNILEMPRGELLPRIC